MMRGQKNIKLDPSSCNCWIQEGPKRWIFGSFSETVRPRKSLHTSQRSLFWFKKNVFLPHAYSDFVKKKIAPKTFGPRSVNTVKLSATHQFVLRWFDACLW